MAGAACRLRSGNPRPDENDAANRSAFPGVELRRHRGRARVDLDPLDHRRLAGVLLRQHDAARGAELVVHAASDTRRFGRADLRQTEHLLKAAKDAEHLLYVSIVGIDSIPYAYYRHKLACEQSIASSGVPYTILRATQFHELIGWLMRAAERLPVAPLPLDFRFQTVAADEVAARTAEMTHGDPRREIVDFGGPEVLTLGQMAELWRTERGRPRRLARLPAPGSTARAFREGRNTCPEHAEGTQTWTQFVASEGENPYRLR